MNQRARLSPAEWTEAALAAMAAEGTAGINIEQLARTLGTTKGSFYHHFENRQDLLDAALTRWEELVRQDLEAVSDVTGPYQRLLIAAQAGVDSGLDGFVDVALASSLNDPAVATSVERINNARLGFLQTELVAFGLTPKVAKERSVAGLASYLGLYQVQRVTSTRFSADELKSKIADIIDWITQPQA